MIDTGKEQIPGPQITNPVLERMVAPARVLRAISPVRVGKGIFNLTLFGSMPVARYISTSGLITVPAAGQSVFSGSFGNRCLRWGVWNFDAANPLEVQIDSSEGGSSGNRIHIPANYFFTDELQMPGDAKIIAFNNAGAGVQAQLLLWGY